MKQKRNKIIARVSAVVAVVALLVVMAIPVFAMIVEENVVKLHTILGIGYDVRYDPLQYLMNESGYFDEPNSLADSVLWYRGRLSVKNGDAYNATYPTSNIANSYSTEMYWCIVWENDEGIDYSYGYGLTGYTYSWSSTSGNYYTWQFNGTKTGVYSSQSNGLQIRVLDGVAYVTVNIDGTARQVTQDTTVRFGFISNSMLNSNATLMLSRGVNFIHEINVNPQSFQLGTENGGSDITEADLEAAYNEGYNAGSFDGSQSASLVDLITAIFRAPMEFVNNAMSFEVFGIQMATAMKVLISMAIIGVVVTFIWKAVK